MGKIVGVDNMEEECLDSILFYSSIFEGIEVVVEEEEEEDDFISCCEGDDLEEKNEELGICNDNDDDDVDDFSVRMYFRGVSVAPIVDSCSGLSGIGVVMERKPNSSPILVQKKMDFFVDEYVADYLALMDGLIEAKQNKITKVFAFTDSASLCDQINHNKCLEDDTLLVALRERILEHTDALESFSLELVSGTGTGTGTGTGNGNDLHGTASELARVAIGLVSFPLNDNESIETCSICCESKLGSMMITVKCKHRFCSQCMKTYVENKLESSQVPIRCPEHLCTYCLTTSECKTFLPLNTYDNFEKAFCVVKGLKAKGIILPLYTIHCPHPDCSVLLDPSCFSTKDSRLECPVCQRGICVKCKVPWHTLLTCQQYRISSFVESPDHVRRRQRRCQQCYRMLEQSSGCCHMSCSWCRYEYQDEEPSCECMFSEEDDESEYGESDPSRAWDTYDSHYVYSDQERSEEALINRFLAGDFSLSDEKDYESSPSYSSRNGTGTTDTCADVMKDLHELPWLESFVTLIDDTYNEDYL